MNLIRKQKNLREVQKRNKSLKKIIHKQTSMKQKMILMMKMQSGYYGCNYSEMAETIGP